MTLLQNILLHSLYWLIGYCSIKGMFLVLWSKLKCADKQSLYGHIIVITIKGETICVCVTAMDAVTTDLTCIRNQKTATLCEIENALQRSSKGIITYSPGAIRKLTTRTQEIQFVLCYMYMYLAQVC